MNFTHCHVHTPYSFLDGFAKIPDMLARCKELDMKACAITDHNHLGGIPEFQQECLKYNVKPLLGVESYFTLNVSKLTDSLDNRIQDAYDKAVEAGVITSEQINNLTKEEKQNIYHQFGYDTRGYHIILIAKNQEGWNNLVKLQSESARLGTFNGRYHCDLELLEKYRNGLIVTTACVASFPNAMLIDHRNNAAITYILKMEELFGDDFYLEIQPWDDIKQHTVNIAYQQLSEFKCIKTIATNDVHWVHREDHEYHTILYRCGLGKNSYDEEIQYDPVFWFRSAEEMMEAFITQADSIVQRDIDKIDRDKYLDYCKTAIANTQDIVDKVEPDIKLSPGYNLFPSIKIEDTAEELRKRAQTGLDNYLATDNNLDKKKYQQQLDEELNIINQKGFAPYFLTVEEFVIWARNNNIPVGPGRGSAAGSLVLFCLGVTKVIDPLKYGLLFSRFLTKDRTALPDIDVDISWLQRNKVIHHLKEYYGQENVSHIGTITRYKVKSAIKDAARYFGISFQESNEISKQLDSLSDDPNLSFEIIDSWNNPAEEYKYQQFKKLENQYFDVFKVARKFEDIPRQPGIHASGILVTPMPISSICPVRYKDDISITLWEGTVLDALKFCKLDVLGLKTLDQIDIAIKDISPKATIDNLYSSMNLNDPAIYEMLRAEQTDGLFQLGSNLMKSLMHIIQPENLNDIIAINAMARPGPLSCSMHTSYARVKNNSEHDISLKLIRNCDDILKPVYGQIIYQEQLMAISKRIAGFDDNQADALTRKTIAKKKQDMWHMLVRCHIYGKKNEKGPEGWEENDNLPWYDPKGKYGAEIPGAVSKGYTKAEIEYFFNYISNFSSYLFNKSHSATYSLLGICTAWLKLYHPVEFWTAALTIFAEDAEKIVNYAKVFEQQDIKLRVPDINLSCKYFTSNVEHSEILFGLCGIKGIGDTAIKAIIEARESGPFISLKDFNQRVNKTKVNIKVLTSLIKAGCFEFCGHNRYKLINEAYKLRKTKGKQLYDEHKWNERACMEFEQEVLGMHITYKTWYENLLDGEVIQIHCKITQVKEIIGKYGPFMVGKVDEASCTFDTKAYYTYLKLSNEQKKQTLDIVIQKRNDKLRIVRINNEVPDYEVIF